MLKGYPDQPKRKRSVQPEDRFLSFITIDVDDEDAIRKFCQEYLFIPRDLTKGHVGGFRQERAKMEPFLDKFRNGEGLSFEELETINSELQSIHPKVRYVSVDYLNEVDYARLGTYDDVPFKKGDKYLFAYDHVGNPVASMWFDLVKLLTGKQNIRVCPQCGKFFKFHRKDKEYCGETCKNSALKKRSRNQKRKMTNK